MLELIIGQIPEAIYFALFMIYAKGLKEKRILFTVLMVAEYILLTRFLIYNIWFQILYTFITFLILKVLYKEKAQVTDIFTFTISSVILMILSCITFLIFNIFYKNMLIASLFLKILMILFFIIFYKKLYKIQNLYKKLWNRNDKVKKKIKSITFRCINLIIFNLSFYILNIIMLYCIFLKK